MTQTQKKTTALFKLMEIFLDMKRIDLYESEIYYKMNLEEDGNSRKKLERYLNDLEMSYDHIISIKKGHKKVWMLLSVSDVFQEFINNSEDISQLFLLAQDFDSEIFKELEKGTLSKIAKNDEAVFLFKNSIMEDIRTPEAKIIFKHLKNAIKNCEYRDFEYLYDQKRSYKNEKCLKLIFMDNNWYLAVIDTEGILRFRRLSFISKVGYSVKNSFQKEEIKSYLEFLKKVQNSMTLYGVEPKVATIKATRHIAKYFDEGMKKFLPSQTFKSKEDDGSVLFTLKYTQALEVLPLIQRWLPDLIIIEPQELKDAYVKKLKAVLQNHSN